MINDTKKRLNDLGNFPFVFILIAIAIFLLVNGQAFFEGFNAFQQSQWGVPIESYVLMMLAFILWAKKETRQHLKMPLKDALPGFLFGMGITLFLINFAFASGFMSPQTLEFPETWFWPATLLTICVVGTAEEIIFRGVFLEYTGILISSILFAVWHSWVYSLNIGNMIFAFAIGMLLALIVENGRNIHDSLPMIEKKHKIKLGLPMAIAIHATYNLCIIGTFYLW